MKKEFSRRDFLFTVGRAAAGATAGIVFPHWNGLNEEFATVKEKSPEYPPVFFSETGHHLSGIMLEAWRADAHGTTLGKPISELLPQKDGSSVQFFQSAAVHALPETGELSFLALGRALIEANPGLYDQFLIKDGEEPIYVSQEFYTHWGGEATFGKILTHPIRTVGAQIQITENHVILEYDRLTTVPKDLTAVYEEYYVRKMRPWGHGRSRRLWPGETIVFPIGTLFAKHVGADTTPVTPASTASAYSHELWAKDQRIYVDLSEQRLYAMEGDLLVMETPVSTGRSGFDTPTTDQKGTVVDEKILAMTYNSPFPETFNYNIPNVPWNLRRNDHPEVFIHGAYWHEFYGKVRSAGCINVNLAPMSWLYSWSHELVTPNEGKYQDGTPVYVFWHVDTTPFTKNRLAKPLAGTANIKFSTTGTMELPELLIPSSERVAEPLYERFRMNGPHGERVEFYQIMSRDELANAPVIPQEELRLPLSDIYQPKRGGYGYFKGHPGWDITYSTAPQGIEGIEVFPPHDQAILFLAFLNVPLGGVAERLQASGAMTVYYVTIDQGNDGVKPYLISYAHLRSEEIPETVEEAGLNHGRVTRGGFIGNTGRTDGRHVHIQVLDLSVLYKLSGTDNPMDAYGYLLTMSNTFSQEDLLRIFVDPSKTLYPKIP